MADSRKRPGPTPAAFVPEAEGVSSGHPNEANEARAVDEEPSGTAPGVLGAWGLDGNRKLASGHGQHEAAGRQGTRSDEDARHRRQ